MHLCLGIEDLPTATKTYQNDNSLSRLGLSTPKGKKHLKHEQRFQQAKSDINSIINEMSSKKNINMEGLQRVRAVNADALGTYKPGYQNQQYRSSQNHNNADYGDYNPQSQAGIFSNQNSNEGYEPNLSPGLKSYNGMSLQDENIELSRALNDQIRENNFLLKKINHLENENDQLRDRLGLPSPRKNLRSTYYSSNPNLSYPSINHNSNVNNNNNYPQGYDSQQQTSPYFNTYNGTPEAMSSEYDRTAKFGQPNSSWNTTHQMNSPKSSHNAFEGRQRNLSPVDLLK